MRARKPIRVYFDDYVKYYPEIWEWRLDDSYEQADLYRRTRARRNSDTWGEDNDKLPDFYSIERDANQFELTHVKWTDFFGLIWIGKKGTFARVGAPNYEGNLYYYDAEDEYDELPYHVEYNYDAYRNQPPVDIYTRVKWCGINRWIDTANVCGIEYKYHVNNHLFKDTHIELTYDDGEVIHVYDDYMSLINGLLKQGKRDLVEIVFKSMNEHFIKLRDSDRDDVKKYYPGKTAEEMFLKDESEELRND